MTFFDRVIRYNFLAFFNFVYILTPNFFYIKPCIDARKIQHLFKVKRQINVHQQKV